MSADIGLIGLAVMGENLVLNMERNGFTVAVHNRTTSKVDEFVNGRGKDKKFVGCHTMQQLVASLKAPRKVMIMVRAGSPVDDNIKQLIPLLSEGDIIIDGGNSEYIDTNRRVKECGEHKILFVGAGVSGGEEGALWGPSIMPGGAKEAWPHLKPIFQAIAAKVENGVPCCDWVGDAGSGHFVKMVHNGIEYGDMQLIAESYHFMKNVLGMNNDEMSATFSEWNKGDLDSYLIEITAQILAKKDGDDYVVDYILDTAGQKGTGKWTAINALDIGQPLTLIAESVFARCLSSLKEHRVLASQILSGPVPDTFSGNKKEILAQLAQAMYASKIVSYAQGYTLMMAAAKEYNWDINYGGIALMWRGGCIIRSTFLGDIKNAFTNSTTLPNLLLDPYFAEKVKDCQVGWRKVLCAAIMQGIPTPCMTSALAYYDGLRTSKGPANLIQAQRDFFGAHTYERIDRKKGEFFHTNWTGTGGSTASSTYNV